MTISEIFSLALKMGADADPRGPKGVKRYLKRMQKRYDELKADDKKYFDKEKLTNPYADSRIHLGAGSSTKVERILAGVDADEGEVLLADRLGAKKQRIDLLLGHHPVGNTLVDLHSVMDMLIEMFHDAGVPIHVAENLMNERIREVGRGVHPSNFNQPVDMAKILGVNILNVHTPCDNLVTQFLNNLIKKTKPETVGEIVKMLMVFFIAAYFHHEGRYVSTRRMAGIEVPGLRSIGPFVIMAALAVLPVISKGEMIADIIAVIGSIDIVMGELDR